jgi:hypothetical protein
VLLKYGGTMRRTDCQHQFDYFKQIAVFKNGGKTFHYKEKCILCGKSKFVKRTKEIYELVKNKQWIISPRTRQKLKRNKLFYGNF